MPIKDENVVENMILGSWNRTQNENGQYTDLNLGPLLNSEWMPGRIRLSLSEP